MAHNPKAIANYFIELSKKEDEFITPMKLQKLVYFAHGWYLALTGKPLINEKIEAWQYGPVVNSLYQEFKIYGNNGITSPAIESRHLGNFRFANIIPTVEDDDVKKLLEKIWDTYGGYTGWQLSNATHLEGTPWSQVWGKDGVPSNTDIPDEKIKNFFIKQMEESE